LVQKFEKLVVLHKVGGAVEISKAGGTNNTVQNVEKTIQRTPGNQFSALSKVWPLVLEQHI
jgi:hypothetical protein